MVCFIVINSVLLNLLRVRIWRYKVSKTRSPLKRLKGIWFSNRFMRQLWVGASSSSSFLMVFHVNTQLIRDGERRKGGRGGGGGEEGGGGSGRDE